MMEELIKWLSEKLDVDASKISATSHLIDDLDSDDWTNFICASASQPPSPTRLSASGAESLWGPVRIGVCQK